MYKCWSYGKPNIGCTHYEYDTYTKVCRFFERKDNSSDSVTRYNCAAVGVAYSMSVGELTSDQIQLCKEQGRSSCVMPLVKQLQH